MRVELKSVCVDFGEQFAMTYGIAIMPGWPVDSLVTQKLVSFVGYSMYIFQCNAALYIHL